MTIWQSSPYPKAIAHIGQSPCQRRNLLKHGHGIGSARSRQSAYAEVLAQDICVLSVRETHEALAGALLRRRQRHARTDELRPCGRHNCNASTAFLHAFQRCKFRACDCSVTA